MTPHDAAPVTGDVRVIAGPLLASGFRLAGLSVDEVATPRAAGEVLERLAAEGGTGVILLQQDYFDGIAEPLRRAVERWALPIVVPIPAAAWDTRRGAVDYIVDLLQRAIGYRVRLQ